MEVNRRSYYRSVSRIAWRGLSAETMPRIFWGGLVITCTVVVGSIWGTLKAGAVAGVVGGVGGLLAAGVLMLLWRLVSAPAEMHAEQETRTAELAEKCAGLEARCVELEGGRLLLSEELEVVALDHLPGKWGGSDQQTSIMLRCLRSIPGPFALSVRTDASIESGQAILSAAGIREDGAFERQEYRSCRFRFEGPLELPDIPIEVVAEDPPTFIQHDALLTLWVGAKEPVEFREIEILSGATPPAAPPHSKSGS